MKYTFVISRARSSTSCPTVHLGTCQHVQRITNPFKIFDADGPNALAALDKWQSNRNSLFDLAAIAEPGRCCLS